MKLPWEMTNQQFKVFLACTICAFIATFSMVMVASVVKEVSKEYSVTFLDGIWVAEATAISAAVFSLLASDLGDKFGKRRVVVFGMLIIIASYVMSAASTNFVTLLISRTVSGAGSAMVFSGNVSILSDIVKKEYMPEVMSFNHSATSIGGVCGPIFGYFIANSFGLTVLFISTIPICLVAVILLRCANNVVVSPEKKINYPLHALTIITAFCLLSGIMSTGNESLVMLSISAVLALAVIYFYRRSKNKIFNFSIMRNRAFLLATVIGLMFTVCVYAVDNSMSYYLQIDRSDLSFFGIMIIGSAALAAFTKGIKPIIQIIASPTVARLCRGKDPNRVSSIGFILLLVTFGLWVILKFMDEDGWIVIILICISALMAFANSIFKPMNKSVMMMTVVKEERNAASAVVNIVDNIGRLVGTFVIVNVMMFLGEISIFSMDMSVNVIAGIVLVLTVLGLFLCIKRRIDNDRASEKKEQ